MRTMFLLMLALGILAGIPLSSQASEKAPVILVARDAAPLEQFAAREVRRYLYVRTDELAAIVSAPEERESIAVLSKDDDLLDTLPLEASVKEGIASLGPDAYWLKTVDARGAKLLVLAGGSDLATLYAAYRFAEQLGVRFYMHGDTIPDARIPFAMPDLDLREAPLFSLRGIQPFHDFPEGPDWWSGEDYLAIIGQLPKMRMNFFGLHTYPEDRPVCEPTTWIGPPQDVLADGSPDFAYPASWFNTVLPGWGFAAKKTGDYACGAAALYDRDDYGNEVMRGMTPKPDSLDQCIEVFDRTADMFHEAFTRAHDLGVKTCLGTETPLIAQKRLAEHMNMTKPPLHPVGGSVASTASPIEDTPDPTLYQTVRWNLQAYQVDVPNGAYTVTLKFSEITHNEPGKRVFSVKLQGQPAIEALDIVAKVGKNHALDYTFKDVQVTDGKLNIEFVPQVEYPCVSAIAVEGADRAWKVNCGGSTYSDYAADDGVATLTSEQRSELYEGIFTRISRVHPLDYYWFWTPEGWTWSGVSKEAVEDTVRDLQTAHDAWERVKAPFKLATCGWVLGPQYDRAYLDKVLPKDMAFSCINRMVGHEAVEPGFANVAGRDKWAIPWLEDDPALTSMQLWAGRMRRDARDALKYGCNGLMGIHWRTRILSPNVAALAQAAWKQGDWKDPETVESGVLGGNCVTFQEPVSETDEPEIYRSVRYDVSGYRLMLPNGAYRVTLKFNEPHYREKEKRVFGVKLQDKPVVDKLDIFEKVGRNHALDLHFDNVEVNDGRLAIDFVKVIELPVIAGIVVAPQDKPDAPVVKINCGGEAFKDYSADLKALKPHPAADDFYRDWAVAEFGPKVAEAAAAVFAKVDGVLPRPSNWYGGPGGFAPMDKPWDEVKKDYAFVEELAVLRPQVQGAGNMERFDYWLDNFQFLRATAHMSCVWSVFNKTMDRARSEKDAEARKRLAREEVLPQRKALLAAVHEAYRHLLATVSTAGEMGTVTNFEQHTLPDVLEKPGKELAEWLGAPLPEDAQLASAYDGHARLIVPTKRTALQGDESLKITVILLDTAPAKEGVLKWRAFGERRFEEAPLRLTARQTYLAEVPAQTIAGKDFEYYVEMETSSGAAVVWPPTAPELNQTVLVTPDLS